MLPFFPGFENTFATTTDGQGSTISRTGSPDRTASPVRVLRALSPMRGGDVQPSAVDVDPEAVRMALRDFVNQLAGAERERVS